MATQYSDNIVKPEPQVSGTASPFVIRKIGPSDLGDALRLGWQDFTAVPSHAIILCVIYPVLGLVLFSRDVAEPARQLLSPLAAGFTLIGPFAALGRFFPLGWWGSGQRSRFADAMHVLRAPSFG